MSVIRRMYQGKLNLFEMKMPKSTDFLEAVKRTKDAARELQKVLNEEQWELYEAHENARSILEDKEQEEFFVLGFKLGLRLRQEVLEEDELLEMMEEELCH